MKKATIDVPAVSATTAALRSELSAASGLRILTTGKLSKDITLQVGVGRDSLWILARRPHGAGFALRAGYAPGASLNVEVEEQSAEGTYLFHVTSSLGVFKVIVHLKDGITPLLRCTVRLTPESDLLLPFWPRDLYPLDTTGKDPTATIGEVHAAQRGLNAAIVYLSLTEPTFGSLLYYQNLTALNDYFLATGTKPDGCVGGDWPELGYQMPISTDKPLLAGKEVVLSDVILAFRPDAVALDPRQEAGLFLEMLTDIYRLIDRPETVYHNWPHRAQRTLHDLETSPKVTTEQYGHRYIRPYVDAEYPDSMVQLTVLTPIKEYGVWKQEEIPFADALRGGIRRFYDKELSTIRRYLPNVGKDKNADEVDSWYLYHPLTNLARLAIEHGDTEARDLFLAAVEYGIKVARHFKYVFPIQFDVRTLDIIKKERKPGDPGQSDAAGLYAYVLLKAWDLTEEKRYLDEACHAIRAIQEMRFNLEYQSNISFWGANACLRLWRITGDSFYRDESQVFLANFFHNTLFWESQIGMAEHYQVFLGATCLHDGPYMALYECFESFAAAHEHLQIGGDDLSESVVLLLTEYCKYALTRAWYYYPDALPKEALATENRNGEIDRHLSIPVEDLYGDGQLAGQVGQEVYGSGAAFTFTVRAYRRCDDLPFLIYSEYPVYELMTPVHSDKTERQCVSFRIRGAAGFTSRIRLVARGRKPIPAVAVTQTVDTKELPLSIEISQEGQPEFFAPAGGMFHLYWNKK